MNGTNNIFKYKQAQDMTILMCFVEKVIKLLWRILMCVLELYSVYNQQGNPHWLKVFCLYAQKGIVFPFTLDIITRNGILEQVMVHK